MELISMINLGISTAIVIIFLTVIVTIWASALLFYWQARKGKPLFVHKVWRIMPAISGGLLLLSLIGFLILGLTALSNVTPEMHWLLDVLVIYFLALFYLLILSCVVRYENSERPANKIATSAHIAVILLFIVLFLIPGIG